MVTASDISRGRLRYLPWDHDDFGRDRGAQLVEEAVRTSISIPFFYRPVRWGSADGRKVWLVDGGHAGPEQRGGAAPRPSGGPGTGYERTVLVPRAVIRRAWPSSSVMVSSFTVTRTSAATSPQGPS